MKTSATCLFAAFLLIPSHGRGAFQYEVDKVPVLVMQSEVTVDGEERPALGRSFTDKLTGGLLKSGAFSVIDYLSNAPIAAEIAKSPAGRPPELSATQFGQMTGAHLVYVPRLIVEEDFLRMTVKKIRVADGAVLAVYESETRGDRGTMFTLAEDMLGQIYSEVSRERAERSASDRRMRKAGETPVEDVEPRESPIADPEAEMPAVTPPSEVVATPPVEIGEEPETGTGAKTEPAPLAMAARKPEKKAQPTQDLGTVTSVNLDYAFCILSLLRSAEVEVGDEVRVQIDDPLVPMVKLRVSKIDGRQAVAERVSGGSMDRIVPGQRAIRINVGD